MDTVNMTSIKCIRLAAGNLNARGLSILARVLTLSRVSQIRSSSVWLNSFLSNSSLMPMEWLEKNSQCCLLVGRQANH